MVFSLWGYGQTTAKINATTLLGLPQIGIETGLGKKTTFQVDFMASLWKSVNGAPHDLYMLFPEVRYYTKQKFDGFYVGGHIGGAKYKLQKWNYINTDSYQDGYSIFYGATIGYQLKINEKFSFDVFLGGGSQQGFYKGYLLSTGERYEDAKDYNKSGEWLVYRGGIMVAYKLY